MRFQRENHQNNSDNPNANSDNSKWSIVERNQSARRGVYPSLDLFVAEPTRILLIAAQSWLSIPNTLNSIRATTRTLNLFRYRNPATSANLFAKDERC